LNAEFLSHLQSELSRIKNKTTAFTNYREVFGGDINTAYIVNSHEETFFVKLNDIAFADMLQKEGDGLKLLRAANTNLKIPEPILHGTYKQQGYLLMEYLEKGAKAKPCGSN